MGQASVKLIDISSKFNEGNVSTREKTIGCAVETTQEGKIVGQIKKSRTSALIFPLKHVGITFQIGEIGSVSLCVALSHNQTNLFNLDIFICDRNKLLASWRRGVRMVIRRPSTNGYTSPKYVFW